METEIVSKRTIIILLFGSSLFILLFPLVSFVFPASHITACGGERGMTYVVRYRNSIDVLVSNGSVKEMLHCLGKALPFYDRTIEYVDISSQESLKTLESRYHIQRSKKITLYRLPPFIFKRTDNYYILHNGPSKMIFFLSTTVSPFDLSKILGDIHPIRVYTPLLSPVHRSLLGKWTRDTSLMKEFKPGAYMTEKL